MHRKLTTQIYILNRKLFVSLKSNIATPLLKYSPFCELSAILGYPYKHTLNAELHKTI